MGSPGIPHRHVSTDEFAHALDVLGHQQIQTANNSRGAEESNFVSFTCFGIKEFHVVDQHIGRIIEQRSLKLAIVFDPQSFDVDPIVFRAHFFDAVDDRRSIIVAIGDPDSIHSTSNLSYRCLMLLHKISLRDSAREFLNSTPRLLARDRRAIAQGAELGPSDLRMNAATQAAVGAGDDVFPADEFSELNNPIGDQFGVFDQIGGVADDTRNQDLAGRKFHVAPDFVFMFVADIAGFDQVRLGVDTEHDIDDIAQREIGGVRTMPAAPADVITHAIDRDVVEGMIQNVHPLRGVAAVLLDAWLRIEHVPGAGETGIVKLEDEAGVDDGAILFTHRIGDRFQEFLGGRVVAILIAAEHLEAAGRDGADERLFDAGGVDGELQVDELILEKLLRGVDDRAGAGRTRGGDARRAEARVGVEFSELALLPAHADDAHWRA